MPTKQPDIEQLLNELKTLVKKNEKIITIITSLPEERPVEKMSTSMTFITQVNSLIERMQAIDNIKRESKPNKESLGSRLKKKLNEQDIQLLISNLEQLNHFVGDRMARTMTTPLIDKLNHIITAQTALTSTKKPKNHGDDDQLLQSSSDGLSSGSTSPHQHPKKK